MKNRSHKNKMGLSWDCSFLIVVISMASCNSSNESNGVIVVEQGKIEDKSIITLTESQFTNSNMKFVKLSDHEFSQLVKANGMFEAPPESNASVSAYFGGYVKALSLLPGQQVRKGQMLFILENPDYVQIQEDFLEAKGQLKYLKADYERQKKLVEEDITSQKTFLKAESEYLVTLAKYESEKKVLNLMGINPGEVMADNITTTIEVRSPIGGYVDEVNASIGMFLNPQDVAVRIIDSDHLHVELSVFEKDVFLIKIGQQIRFKLQNDLNEEYSASVHLVSKSIDPEKRTSKVHGHLLHDDEGERFVPGMYIEAEVIIDAVKSPALPQEAVVNIDKSYFVIVKKSSNAEILAFEKAEVRVGKTDQGFVQIINHEDFGEDSEFLAEGAFNLIQE
ncbi:MAG: efflux RND transporter periplasmic adaptor subunit [Bacteroidetes bacterium]|nr:efflux RND transporter periplasmic adaptor subunit [Bacteroidota bacterium]MDA1121194.1 efflux RND transporter periplasmic adaptor subunit [Bacteroidota bacterium]